MYARYAMACTASVLLLGCAGTGKECAFPQATGKDAAEVIVFYPIDQTHKFIFNPDQPISIDECIVGELKYGSYFRYRVTPHAHKVRVEAPAMASFDVPELERKFTPGERVYVQFRVEARRLNGSMMGAHGILAETNKNYAQGKVPALYSIDP